MGSEQLIKQRIEDLMTRRNDITNIIERTEELARLLIEIIDEYNSKVSDIDEEILNLAPKTCGSCRYCEYLGNKGYVCKNKGVEINSDDALCVLYEKKLPF